MYCETCSGLCDHPMLQKLQDEGRLLPDQQRVLSKWITGTSSTFELIYSVTKDKETATEFHKLCDKKRSTVTIVYDVHGSVFGGYTEEGFGGDDEWKTDQNAFLFWLVEGGSKKEIAFNYTNKGKYAIYNHKKFGPTFGKYCTFQDELEKQGTVFQSKKPTHKHDIPWTLGRTDKNPFEDIIYEDRLVKEIEVYKIGIRGDDLDSNHGGLAGEKGFNTVQLYCERTGTTVEYIHKELIRWLKDINVNVQRTELSSNQRKFKNPFPVIVPCIFETRMLDNVLDELENLPETGLNRIAFIVFHIKRSTEKADPGNDKEIKDMDKSFQGVRLYHMTFLNTEESKQIYQCDTNKKTLSELVKYLHTQKK